MPNIKLYVGNLNYSVSSEQLQKHFSKFGEIESCKIIDGKGFGFIQFTKNEIAQKAAEELDGSDFLGRTMRVQVAREQSGQDRRGFGGGSR